MNVVVYTSIFGNYDQLRPARFRNVRHICFTDSAQGIEGWEEIEVNQKHVDPKREASMYLALSHLWFPEAQYTIYHGGCGELLRHPDEIVALLGDRDVATFKHPTRDCIYDEAAAVIGYGKANPNVVRAQVAYYRAAGYPEHIGLVATGLVIRRHTDEIVRFNEIWWALMSRFTARDQLSFNFARWKTWILWRMIPGGSSDNDRLGENDYVVRHEHGR